MNKLSNRRDIASLAALLTCLGLATSRLGLVAHELVGHGGVALAVGARVVGVKLFWFAGGWIRYVYAPSTAAALAIAMAGIAVELAAGVAIWLALRRAPTTGARLVRAIGAALVVHAGWYLATGAWHGFGDGALLYQQLGDARAAVAVPAGALTCVAAYAGARCAFGALVSAARPAGVAIAIVCALAVNAGLAAGELYARRDATYAETMAPERDRAVARDLAQWEEAQRRRGVAIDADAEARERARLEDEHRAFPFWLVLAVATLAAIIAGARRSQRVEPAAAVPPRLVARAAIVAGAALAAVIALATLL
jgi:hypothetical protein